MDIEPVVAEVKSVLLFGEGAPSNADPVGFVPPDLRHFGVSAQVFIGQVGDDRSDSFDVSVCTPSWLAQQVREGRWDDLRSCLRAIPATVMPGASFWFMQSWSLTEFLAGLDAVCREYSPAPDWGNVAARIARVVPWEFAYRFDRQTNERAGLPSD